MESDANELSLIKNISKLALLISKEDTASLKSMLLRELTLQESFERLKSSDGTSQDIDEFEEKGNRFYGAMPESLLPGEGSDEELQIWNRAMELEPVLHLLLCAAAVMTGNPEQLTKYLKPTIQSLDRVSGLSNNLKDVLCETDIMLTDNTDVKNSIRLSRVSWYLVNGDKERAKRWLEKVSSPEECDLRLYEAYKNDLK